MKITWIGHSCFKVESQGYQIVLDPYTDGSVPGLKPVREEADQVLCSHEHGDHAGRDCVKLKESKEDIIHVTRIESYHDEVQGAKRGKNTIHILSDGDTRIAHLGDLGCMPEEYQMAMLRNMDVLLIPVGGFFTIDAKTAADLVHQLKPKKVIPMHYSSEQFGYDVLDTVNVFAEQMDSLTMMEGSVYDTESEVQVQVLVLHPLNA